MIFGPLYCLVQSRRLLKQRPRNASFVPKVHLRYSKGHCERKPRKLLTGTKRWSSVPSKGEKQYSGNCRLRLVLPTRFRKDHPKCCMFLRNTEEQVKMIKTKTKTKTQGNLGEQCLVRQCLFYLHATLLASL